MLSTRFFALASVATLILVATAPLPRRRMRKRPGRSLTPPSLPRLSRLTAKPLVAPSSPTTTTFGRSLREHCFTCHNQNTAKSGLAMDSYAKLMAGGSSGEVVIAGDLEGSRLWALASHAEMPYMPPMQDKLPDAKLAIDPPWIEGGALENSGSKVAAKKKPSFALATNGVAGKPSGPAAMPEHLWRQPVVYTPRSGAVTALAASPWAPLVAVAGQARSRALQHRHARRARRAAVSRRDALLPAIQPQRFAAAWSAAGAAANRAAAVAFDVKTGRRVSRSATSSTPCWPATSTTISR